jgi:hypothetical protein
VRVIAWFAHGGAALLAALSAVLFFAVAADIEREDSSDLSAITYQRWCSQDIIDSPGFLSGGNVQPIPVARSMTNAGLICVVDAGQPVELHGLSILERKPQGTGRLPHGRPGLSAWIEGDVIHWWHFDSPLAHPRRQVWRVVNKFISRSLLRNNFPLGYKWIYMIGRRCTHVLDDCFNVASNEFAVWTTGEELNLGSEYVDNAGPMSGFEIPLIMQSAPTSEEQYSEAPRYADTLAYPFELLSSARRFPVAYKAPLLTLGGFVVALSGCLGFRICLSVGGPWWRFFATLLLAFAGIVIFHMGLFSF